MGTEIKLDYDCPFSRGREIMQERGWLLLKLDLLNLQVYKTKRGYHVYANIKSKLKQFEMLLIQSLLDSDFNREILNFLRAHKKGNAGNYLFDFKSFWTDYNLKSHRERVRKPLLEKQLLNIMKNKEVEI